MRKTEAKLIICKQRCKKIEAIFEMFLLWIIPYSLHVFIKYYYYHVKILVIYCGFHHHNIVIWKLTIQSQLVIQLKPYWFQR
jgi:hypothetical protein